MFDSSDELLVPLHDEILQIASALLQKSDGWLKLCLNMMQSSKLVDNKGSDSQAEIPK